MILRRGAACCALCQSKKGEYKIRPYNRILNKHKVLRRGRPSGRPASLKLDIASRLTTNAKLHLPPRLTAPVGRSIILILLRNQTGDLDLYLPWQSDFVRLMGGCGHPPLRVIEGLTKGQPQGVDPAKSYLFKRLPLHFIPLRSSGKAQPQTPHPFHQTIR